MAYHLQKMQQNGLRREDMGKNALDYRGQEGTRSERKCSQRRCFCRAHIAVCVGGNASVRQGLLSLLCARHSSRQSPIQFKVKSRHIGKKHTKVTLQRDPADKAAYTAILTNFSVRKVMSSFATNTWKRCVKDNGQDMPTKFSAMLPARKNSSQYQRQSKGRRRFWGFREGGVARKLEGGKEGHEESLTKEHQAVT